MGSDFELMEWLKKGNVFFTVSALFYPFNQIRFDAIAEGIAAYN